MTAARVYTQAYFDRQTRRARAKRALLDTMQVVTTACGEMTTLDWIAVFSEMIQRMLQFEEAEE